MTAAVWGPPWNLRLVVLDAETCVATDKHHRFVSLGIAVCRDGGVKQRFEWLINPGCALDHYTPRIHKLTDRHLADEPTFDEILPDIRRVIAGRPGETVVLAAHNAGFDVGWLRTEVARVGAAELPDLAVLDTQGAILGLAGLSVRKPKLETLLAALDLGNDAAHTALGDASATAHAAIALLERAETNGHADLDALLAAAGGATSASIPRRNTKATGRAPKAVVAPPLPPGHVATHAGELPAKPTSAQLAEWRTWIRECATHRCDGLDSRVAPEPLFRGLLLETLDATAAAGDTTGTATVLGALRPMLGRLPGSIAEMRRHGPPLTRITGAGNQRGVALALHAWLAPRLDPLGRCPTADPCPACREGEPCPLDTWRTALVPSALGPKPSQVNAFWNTTGQASAAAKGAGRGYLSMRHTARGLADVVLRACLEFHRANGDRLTAALLAEQVWQQARCSDPAVTETRATTMAAAGRQSDLDAALRACHAVLAQRKGSTDPAWVSLEARTAQLTARARRRRATATDRHAPMKLMRLPREPRFLRAS